MLRLLQPASVEAVVNARIVTVRTPIDGRIDPDSAGQLALGPVEAGQIAFHVENPRADRGRLDELERELERVRGEIPILEARIEHVRAESERATEQVERFRQGRIRQLEARVREADSDIKAAEATADEASSSMARETALVKSGVFAAAGLDRIARDRTVAIEQRAAAQQRREGLLVELEAARAGIFVGDSYNDRPQSAQQMDELALRLDEVTAQRDLLSLQDGRLAREIAAERQRFEARASATIPVPQGRIWEVLAAPGEEVSKGQSLVRVLDCANLVVTASVTESVFNTLVVGSPARFQLSGSSTVLPGTVTNLTGVASPPGNLAIEPAALLREPYRVVVSVPDLARGASCAVGRTGRVLFDSKN